MIFEELNNENIDMAIKIQHDIFPVENGSEDLKDSLNGLPEYYSVLKYWLPKVDGKVVGICGIYAYKLYPKDAWLGWFGVIDDERRKGYATEILSFVTEKAKEMGFNALRLYTDEQDNVSAVKLYKKLNMIDEVYSNEEDSHFEISKTLIFSKSLNDEPVKLWNNKNLFLNAHDEKNMKELNQ
ncbi:MAG: GNAT family N-acetyltransferase [Clostridia bacterium]|nr:GNAT family N-acetyltransferase [Clostridia bacterium]